MPTVAEDIVPEPMESVSASVIEKWPATVAVRRQPPRRAQPAPAPIPLVPPAVEEPRDEPHPHSVDIPMEPEPLPLDNPGFEEFGPVPMDVDVSESTEKLLSATTLTNGMSDHFPRSPVPPDESISVGLKRRSGRLREPPEKKTPEKPVPNFKVNKPIGNFLTLILTRSLRLACRWRTRSCTTNRTQYLILFLSPYLSQRQLNPPSSASNLSSGDHHPPSQILGKKPLHLNSVYL